MIPALIKYAPFLRRFIKCTVTIYKSSAPSSVTGTTAKTSLATVAIPVLGPNDSIRVTTKWALTNNANAKVFSADYNGVAVGGANLTGALTDTHQFSMDNRGATNSQIGGVYAPNSFSTSAAAYYTATQDSSISRPLAITMSLGIATDTATLESVTVEWVIG